MSPSTTLQNLYFLVVDDDRALRDLVAAWLAANGAAQVRTAGSVAASVQALADPNAVTDCIICDHGMAPVSGLQFLKGIRSEQYPGIRPDFFFVMLTAS